MKILQKNVTLSVAFLMSRMLKRIITLIITLLAVSSLSAQLRFDMLDYDFGVIAESGGKQSCAFTATNIGSKPIVLVDVVTTCGCTVPTFSRKPIRSGETTKIEVTYDPYGRPGVFERKLHLYGSKNERLAVLTIRGEVTPRERTMEEQYPLELGSGIRASATHCSFTYIYVGMPMRSAISIVNTADAPHRLALSPKQTSGLLAVDCPTTLAAGERSAINFCYEVPTETPRYGTLRDTFSVEIDGVKSDKVLLTHGIAVDRPTKSRKEQPPIVDLSENMLKFGAVKRSAGVQRRRLTLYNRGTSELMVQAVECGEGISTSLQPMCRVPQGGELACEVLFDPSQADYGFVTAWLVLVTNDPNRPMRRVRVTATVED